MTITSSCHTSQAASESWWAAPCLIWMQQANALSKSHGLSRFFACNTVTLLQATCLFEPVTHINKRHINCLGLIHGSPATSPACNMLVLYQLATHKYIYYA